MTPLPDSPPPHPSQETLDAIENWLVMGDESARRLLEFCREHWQHPEISWDHVRGLHRNRHWFKVVSAGSKGNEAIVKALERNSVFWELYWFESRRGGYYKFFIPYDAEKTSLN